MAKTRNPVKVSEFREVASSQFKLYTEQREGKDVPMVRVNIATVGIINRNSRFYPRSAFEGANERAQQAIKEGSLWGLLEHPGFGDTAKGRLEKIALKFEELGIEGDTVYGIASVVETDAGKTFRTLYDAGIKIGVSTNGYSGKGKLVKAESLDSNWPDPEELITVMGDDYTYLTIDVVADPSNVGGMIPRESARVKETKMNPILVQLAKKLGISVEQVKLEHSDEYLEALEQAAQTSTPVSANTTSNQDRQTLEEAVLGLTAELQATKSAKVATERRNIWTSALEAAELPKSPVLGELDMNATFRDQLEQAAQSAPSDTEAKKRVDAMIEERRALLTFQSKKQTKSSDSVGAVSLPRGDIENLDGTNRATESRANAINVGRSGLGLR